MEIIIIAVVFFCSFSVSPLLLTAILYYQYTANKNPRVIRLAILYMVCSLVVMLYKTVDSMLS